VVEVATPGELVSAVQQRRARGPTAVTQSAEPPAAAAAAVLARRELTAADEMAARAVMDQIPTQRGHPQQVLVRTEATTPEAAVVVETWAVRRRAELADLVVELTARPVTKTAEAQTLAAEAAASATITTTLETAVRVL
jgi:hypothetical protein